MTLLLWLLLIWFALSVPFGILVGCLFAFAVERCREAEQ